MKEATSVSASFPGYLEAGDLDGKEVTLTIKHVREAEASDKGNDGKKIDRPFLGFEEAQKEYAMPKTVARVIRRLYGNRYEGWKGKKITLYPTTCQAFGETVACVRVKAVNPETGEEPDLF